MKKMKTAAVEILLLFTTGLFIGFLVEKCAACQPSEICFFFQNKLTHLTLLDSSKRVEKSQAII